MGPETVENYLATGLFEWKVPFLGTIIRWQDPNGKPPCDWVGINYYSRRVARPVLA
jgi:hypothetical protein